MSIGVDFERVNAEVFGLADLNPRGLNRRSFRRFRRVRVIRQDNAGESESDMPRVAGAAIRTTLLGIVLIALVPAAAYTQPKTRDRQDRMSAMGRLAARARARLATGTSTPSLPGPAPFAARSVEDGDDDGTGRTNPTAAKASLTVRPPRSRRPPSRSTVPAGTWSWASTISAGSPCRRCPSPGSWTSDDGGQTFTDGGQLPVTTGTVVIGTTLLPQVFGDPDVKYLGGCSFIYSSILIVKIPAGGEAETMGVHRSTDCGHTWEGPYEVEAATNPSGRIDPTGSAVDAADKEFMDVDPDTGRVIMTWTNFGATSVQIRSAISDDGGLDVAGRHERGHRRHRRRRPGLDSALRPWIEQRVRRMGPFSDAGRVEGYGNTTGFALSTDNGLTWEAPVELSKEFLTSDLILGNDRSNTSPSLAVDGSRGRYRGAVYVVYANNDSGDGADIVFQKSTDGGRTFSSPVLLNARPGHDRAQWFPSVTVDDTTGRISVFYYDQGIARSGDLSEVSYLFSNDGGQTWEHPRPLTQQPFHAGHGNDTGQPNLGDYIQAVSSGGRAWFSYALASRPPLGFVDGQPLTTMTVPDATVSIVSPLEFLLPHAPVSLQRVSARVKGGFIDPGETIALRLPLFNYATNPLYAEEVRTSIGLLATEPMASTLHAASPCIHPSRLERSARIPTPSNCICPARSCQARRSS